MAPVVNLSVKFDANVFIGDRYMDICKCADLTVFLQLRAI